MGYYFWDTFGPAVTVCILLFTFLFFGFFLVIALFSAFGASANPWLKDVEHMNGFFFNPVIMAWLFEKHVVEWAAFATGISVIFTLIFGSLLLYLEYSLQKSLIGSLIGLPYLVLLAICWYKGFWEPKSQNHLQLEK